MGFWQDSVSCGLLDWGPCVLSGYWSEAFLPSLWLLLRKLISWQLVSSEWTSQKSQEREKERERDSELKSYNLISEATFCYSCCILFVKGKSPGPVKRRECMRLWMPGGGVTGGHFRVHFFQFTLFQLPAPLGDGSNTGSTKFRELQDDNAFINSRCYGMLRVVSKYEKAMGNPILFK